MIGLLDNVIVSYDLLRRCSIRSIISNKNERYFVPIHIFNANTIHSCTELKLRDFLKNEIKIGIMK